MDVRETHRLLVLASQYDPTLLPRTEQDQIAKATAWNAALDVRMTYEWATTAVASLFANGAETILPGTLNALLLSRLKDDGLPGRGSGPAAIPGSAKAEAVSSPKPALPPAGRPVPPTEEYRQARERLGTPATTDALTVTCPWCGAKPGDRCTSQGRPLLHSPAHPARLEQVRRASSAV